MCRTIGALVLLTWLTSVAPGAAAAANIWLSGSAAIPGGTTLGEIPALSVGSGSQGNLVHVWLRPDPGKTLQSWSLNVRSTDPTVLDFTGVTVYNPFLYSDASGNWFRYELTQAGSLSAPNPDRIDNFAGYTITGNGAGLGPATVGLDPQYDAAADAWLLASISYDAASAGTTALFLQIGSLGINNQGESTSQIDVVFGAATDPGLNGDADRGVDSLTADASVTVSSVAPLDPPQELSGGEAPVEYSNAFDEQALAGGGHGAEDPGQMLYAQSPDGPSDGLPRDALDVFPGLERGTSPDEQVDAIAYGNDASIDELLANTARLVFSVAGDADTAEVAAYAESPDGALDVYLTHAELNASDPPGGLDDVDALELWGPVGADDADYFSLEGDASTGISVYVYNGGMLDPFISHAEIVSAVEDLGYGDEPDLIDVDALMLRNVDPVETFEAGDVLVFSIHGVPGSGFDGDEIIVLAADAPPTFLSHGGHDWDLSFSLPPEPDGDVPEVDAIEAAPLVPLPPQPAPLPALGMAARGLLILLLACLLLAAAGRPA